MAMRAPIVSAPASCRPDGRLLEILERSLELAAVVQRLSEGRHRREGPRVVGGQQRHRAAQELFGRRNVAASQRALSGGEQVLARAGGDRAPGVVDGAELLPVAVRLLEVVSHELVQLPAGRASRSSQSANPSCNSARSSFGIASYTASRTSRCRNR